MTTFTPSITLSLLTEMGNSAAGCSGVPFLSLPFAKSERGGRWGCSPILLAKPRLTGSRRINDLGCRAAVVTQLVCVGLRPR